MLITIPPDSPKENWPTFRTIPHDQPVCMRTSGRQTNGATSNRPTPVRLSVCLSVLATWRSYIWF